MKSVYGKVFKNKNAEEYGTIRETKPPYPNELSSVNVLTEDESGNYFIEVAGEIFFWDHETNEQKFLSNSLNEFISSCEYPSEIELKPGQVKSAWIDPEFAEKLGIKPKP